MVTVVVEAVTNLVTVVVEGITELEAVCGGGHYRYVSSGGVDSTGVVAVLMENITEVVEVVL
jgi:hypothetical protein